MKTLQDWFLTSPVGKYILRKERDFYTNNVKNIFGKFSLQIGMDKTNLLLGNKIVNHYNVTRDINALAQFLPIANDSIDLIVLSHYLEEHNDYKQIIKECNRILAPNGKLIISCLNRHSLIYFFRNKAKLDKYYFRTVTEIEQAMRNNKLNICGGKFFSYTPPIRSNIKLRRLEIFNKMGDRWFPTFANSFTIIADKKIINHTLRMSNPIFKQSSTNTNPIMNTTCNKN
ncbi:MAG: class I SAM-dependent methyltransferase [Burkholderiales bacterium]|nr:class I SAM-dependent methyltransferase [Burkholderiales bacterium]